MEEIKHVVSRLVHQYQTNSPFEIAFRKNIIVLYSKLKDILGYHFTYKRVSTICIHSGLSVPESRFVCAHELGHAVLHPAVNTLFLKHSTLVSVGKIERQANEFAVELLIPDGELDRVSALDDGFTLQGASQKFGVPFELMYLKNLNTAAL